MHFEIFAVHCRICSGCLSGSLFVSTALGKPRAHFCGLGEWSLACFDFVAGAVNRGLLDMWLVFRDRRKSRAKAALSHLDVVLWKCSSACESPWQGCVM